MSDWHDDVLADEQDLLGPEAIGVIRRTALVHALEGTRDGLTLIVQIGDVDPSWAVSEGLPAGYDYRPEILHRFAHVADALARLLASGQTPRPSCVAEEMVLAIAARRAEQELVESGRGIAGDGFADMVTDELCEDTDFLLLYDGTQRRLDDQAVEALGLANLGFAEWFTPFGPDYRLAVTTAPGPWAMHLGVMVDASADGEEEDGDDSPLACAVMDACVPMTQVGNPSTRIELSRQFAQAVPTGPAGIHRFDIQTRFEVTGFDADDPLSAYVDRIVPGIVAAVRAEAPAWITLSSFEWSVGQSSISMPSQAEDVARL